MNEVKKITGKPHMVRLEKGHHAWCACGLSENQPFCDGSHKSTDKKPIVFEVQQSKTVTLCGCKNSGAKPFCDGSHACL